MNYLIVDDEPIAHEIIEEYCKELSFMTLKGNCYNAFQAINTLSEIDVDLIFLDINMPKMKGFDFLRTLDHPPKVIVTSAYQEFALEGYELNVIDYLLKPFSFERFLSAVNKVKKNNDEVVQEANIIRLKGKNQYHQLNPKDIIYIEANGNYSIVYLKRESVIISEKISSLELILKSYKMVRTHKSFLVSVNHIKDIKTNEINMGIKHVPIGRVYKENISSIILPR